MKIKEFVKKHEEDIYAAIVVTTTAFAGYAVGKKMAYLRINSALLGIAAKGEPWKAGDYEVIVRNISKNK